MSGMRWLESSAMKRFWFWKREDPPAQPPRGAPDKMETSSWLTGNATEDSRSIEILLDATDRLNEGDAVAAAVGVQPQIDTLRAMAEPKVQGPGGLKVLSSLGLGAARAFDRQEVASVLVFAWGMQLLPVFLTAVTQKETLHLPNLMPYRAEMGLTMQVIESSNPFFTAEKVRQTVGVGLNVASGFQAG